MTGMPHGGFELLDPLEIQFESKLRRRPVVGGRVGIARGLGREDKSAAHAGRRLDNVHDVRQLGRRETQLRPPEVMKRGKICKTQNPFLSVRPGDADDRVSCGGLTVNFIPRPRQHDLISIRMLR